MLGEQSNKSIPTKSSGWNNKDANNAKGQAAPTKTARKCTHSDIIHADREPQNMPTRGRTSTEYTESRSEDGEDEDRRSDSPSDFKASEDIDSESGSSEARSEDQSIVHGGDDAGSSSNNGKSSRQSYTWTFIDDEGTHTAHGFACTSFVRFHHGSCPDHLTVETKGRLTSPINLTEQEMNRIKKKKSEIQDRRDVLHRNRTSDDRFRKWQAEMQHGEEEHRKRMRAFHAETMAVLGRFSRFMHPARRSHQSQVAPEDEDEYEVEEFADQNATPKSVVRGGESKSTVVYEDDDYVIEEMDDEPELKK